MEYAKSRAKSAEQAFDLANAAIQRKASRSIDLFGGSAQSTVADIARDARRACDDLFSSYQSLIVTLDESCRPLLSQDPALRAVKAVAETMKKLNDDSEIESNFTASLNGSSLGDVAGARYVPSMNCKMIQRYWEDRYAAWPGRAEQEAKERQEAQERKRKQEAAAKEKYDAQMQQYEKDMQAYEQKKSSWEAEAQKVREHRAAELKTKLAARETALHNEARQAYTRRKKELEAVKAQAEEALKAAQAELEAAGFFAFGVKKAAKNTIRTKEAELAELKLALNRAERAYQDEKVSVKKTLEREKEELSKSLEKRYPIPTAPRKPVKPFMPVTPGAATPLSMVNSALQQAILDSMEPGVLYTITDIIMNCPEVADLTNQRVAALVRQLVPEYLVRTTDERKAYFQLA